MRVWREEERDGDIYMYIRMYIYICICKCERETASDRGDLWYREVKEGIAREGCDYNISPRYCYRSRRSEGICYVHCFSFAPSSKRRSRGPSVPFTLLKGIRAHHLYLFSTLSLFSSLVPFFFLLSLFLAVLFLCPPGNFLLARIPGLFHATISTPKKRLTLHSKEREREGNERRLLATSILL